MHVKQLGPYVYKESVEKINVVFNANKTISYRVILEKISLLIYM